jgi:hypothetical protein
VFSGSRSQQTNQKRWSEAEELAEEDKEVRGSMTAKTNLESNLYSVKNMVKIVVVA